MSGLSDLGWGMGFPGIVLARKPRLPTILRPLATELAPCYWLVDVQWGPFKPGWQFGSAENEALIAKKLVDVPACRDVISTCWGPHTFPRLAEHVVIDEWSYFFAMKCRKDDVDRRAEWIVPRIGRLGADFFDGLGDVADLFLVHADGWWEFYSPHATWRAKFAAAFPRSVERSWREAGEAPEKRE